MKSSALYSYITKSVWLPMETFLSRPPTFLLTCPLSVRCHIYHSVRKVREGVCVYSWYLYPRCTHSVSSHERQPLVGLEFLRGRCGRGVLYPSRSRRAYRRQNAREISHTGQTKTEESYHSNGIWFVVQSYEAVGSWGKYIVLGSLLNVRYYGR